MTSLDDVTSDLVLEELYGRGVPVVRLDPGTDFTTGTAMAAHFDNEGPSGPLRTPSRHLDLSAVRSVYWRRPTPYGGAQPATASAEARFVNSQARAGYGGTLAALPGALYINHPWRNRDAEYKPAQLATAAHVGLDLPPTLITNDPDAAKRFVARHAPAVYKPVYAVHVSPDSAGAPARTIWVRTVDPGEIDDGVAACPHLFQACVPKVADVRLAAVGDQLFATRIDIDGDHLDWRQDYNVLTYSPVETPPAMRSAVRAYLDAFGLVFGAFDFAVRDDGRWIWLETNPNGQWAFVDEPTCRAIATALADHLQQGAAR
ncbi:ATP-grasp ribosomal peptide maturase [Streptomyces sp. NPDC048483]|uniref:ATP-grasp ribosomal peptide maturase n=1 Tax=Streptomyces sp. NPDC048483 TaxID=3154927 RepID=UPI00342E869B